MYFLFGCFRPHSGALYIGYRLSVLVNEDSHFAHCASDFIEHALRFILGGLCFLPLRPRFSTSGLCALPFLLRLVSLRFCRSTVLERFKIDFARFRAYFVHTGR